MNVKQLKELIADLPDDIKIVVPCRDHSYRNVSGEVSTALYSRPAGWTEDHGEEATPEESFGKRVQVVVIA